VRGALYWILAAVMIAFGLLAILSIGGPFLLIGCTLVILAPSRRRPIVLATVLAAEIGLVIGYLLVVPLSCVTHGTRTVRTTCIRAERAARTSSASVTKGPPVTSRR
jgi:hypothetical protein